MVFKLRKKLECTLAYSVNTNIYIYIGENDSENVSTQKYDFERRLWAQTQDLQIFKKFYMSQWNPKEFVHNTAYSLQLGSRSVSLN